MTKKNHDKKFNSKKNVIRTYCNVVGDFYNTIRDLFISTMVGHYYFTFNKI